MDRSLRTVSTHRKWTRVLKTVAFVIVFAILLHSISYVLVDKTTMNNWVTYTYEQRDSIDVLWLGCSKTLFGISPLTLWNEYGIASFNIGYSGQRFADNYYNLKAALETQSPKLVVMDIGFINFEGVHEVRFRQFINSLTYSRGTLREKLVKLEAIDEFADKTERFSLLFPLTYYHTEWKTLTSEDFQRIESMDKGAGFSIKSTEFLDFQVLDKSETTDLSSLSSLEMLERIASLCRENNVELLTVAYPCYAMGENNPQRYYNAFYDYAQENNLTYINCFHRLDDIGIDYATDFIDEFHVDYSGNQKLTKYMGKYLIDNYDIPDHRGEEAYSSWDDDYLVYSEYVKTRMGR